MPYTIVLNESNASRRIVYLWCVGSNGTTPSTGEQGGQPTFSLAGGPTISTNSTLRAWNSNQGEYYLTLTQSEVSVVGQAVLRYNSATALETSTPFQVVAFDSGDSMRLGLFALPNAAPAAAGGLPTFGTGAGQLNVSSGSVGVIAGDYSSIVTVGVGNIKAATYSGLTIDGVNRINSSVTPANALYSALTVRFDPTQSFSGVTVGISNIAAGAYSGVSVGILNIDAYSSGTIADSILTRSIAGNAQGGRTIADALRTLRNRVQISGSVMTVYTEDDLTSAWTASVSTVADISISQINPAGGSA